ncbi:MAG: hypothetical protein NTZ74_16065 [Chloroflexi bacterium]|nr:hypothetical protein [Chloroflexota bacterium]
MKNYSLISLIHILIFAAVFIGIKLWLVVFACFICAGLWGFIFLIIRKGQIAGGQ